MTNCKWAPGVAFQNASPFAVNSKIVNFGNQNITLGVHTTVCYCPPSSQYDCSVNRLGPVYPGEKLTADLCLPFNQEFIIFIWEYYVLLF